MRISVAYYNLINSANRTLDVKVQSPSPGLARIDDEIRPFLEPNHVLVRKAIAGVVCRVICLAPEPYSDFFRNDPSRMAESPYFEAVQDMLNDLQKAGGNVRRVTGGTAPELCFAIADRKRAIMFLGAWPPSGGFQRAVFETSEPTLINFLTETFEICWIAK